MHQHDTAFSFDPPEDIAAQRLADRLALIGSQVQWVARQGEGAWFPTELVNVPTDDDGGGYQGGPSLALPPEHVDLVPLGKRRWVTLADLEREKEELERELAAIDADALDGHTLEVVKAQREFAAKHLQAARDFVGDRLATVLRPLVVAPATGPRLRQAQTSRRSHRSNAPPADTEGDQSGEGDPEPAPVEARIAALEAAQAALAANCGEQSVRVARELRALREGIFALADDIDRIGGES